MICLLSVCMVMMPSHAQEISDTLQGVEADSLKKSACIPVTTVREDELAYQAGERLYFTLSYQLGALHTDLAEASVSLDKQIFNGKEGYNLIKWTFGIKLNLAMLVGYA